MEDPLWETDAAGQAELIQRGEVTPLELVEAAIRRIEALEPRVNALVSERFDEARAEARACEPGSAPFAGVPIVVKDAGLEISGTPHYCGLRLLKEREYRSQRTTPFARKIAAAGFIVLGKTNVPELSTGITTEPDAFGPTRNPWDLDRTPCGSSGGSAAAVASGMVALAHGADGSGSLRYPASACGLVTLKPSFGAVPATPPAGGLDPLGVWSEFFLARTVRDLAGCFRATVGPIPSQRASEALRVGLLCHDPMLGLPVHDACVAAVQATGRSLRSLGHDVGEKHPPALDGVFARIAVEISTVGAWSRATQVRWLEQIVGRPLRMGEISDELYLEAQRGERVSEEERAGAGERVHAALAPVRDWWRGEGDLLVMPTLRQPPWPLGERPDPTHSGLFCIPASLTGQPALSLPIHVTDDGLPVGVQIVADRGRDGLLLELAAELEAIVPWRDRRPELAYINV